jgi:hypothetical protein
MGIRETLNNRPGIATGVAIAAIAIAAGVMAWTSRETPTRLQQAYYSDDDGKSWFADDVDKVYPFERNGKPAYRAYVYQCGNEKPFVHYLARYNDSTKAKLEKLVKSGAGDPDVAAEVAELRGTGIELKKPGDSKWVPQSSSDGEALQRHPQCPNGAEVRGLAP